MFRKDETTFYFGCPRSESHLCADSEIGIHESKYSKVYPCSLCEFSIHGEHLKCRKRFMDLHLPPNTEINIISKNEEGFISKISYLISGKETVVLTPTFKNPLVKSIYSLWKENTYKTAIFKNLKTNRFVKIIKSPNAQKKKYGKVYGFLSSTQYSFNGNSLEIYGWERNEWICVWHKDKNDD